jgi:hypothetical protein
LPTHSRLCRTRVGTHSTDHSVVCSLRTLHTHTCREWSSEDHSVIEFSFSVFFFFTLYDPNSFHSWALRLNIWDKGIEDVNPNQEKKMAKRPSIICWTGRGRSIQPRLPKCWAVCGVLQPCIRSLSRAPIVRNSSVHIYPVGSKQQRSECGANGRVIETNLQQRKVLLKVNLNMQFYLLSWWWNFPSIIWNVSVNLRQAAGTRWYESARCALVFYLLSGIFGHFWFWRSSCNFFFFWVMLLNQIILNRFLIEGKSFFWNPKI